MELQSGAVDAQAVVVEVPGGGQEAAVAEGVGIPVAG